MFEKYFTTMAILIIMRGICIFPYIFILKRTKLRYKKGSFILNRWFNSYNANTWRIFWASVLWLIIFYFSFISLYVNKLLIALGLESLAF